MVVKIKIDASDVYKAADVVERTSIGMDDAMAPAVNRAGEHMHRNLTEYFSDFLSETISKFFEKLPAFKEPFFGQPDSIIKELYETFVPRKGLSKDTPEYEVEVRPPQYFRWVTQKDESVCEICGPLDGAVLPEDVISALYPAHQHCRCSLERIDITEKIMPVAEKEVMKAAEEGTDSILQVFTRLFRKE